MKLKLKGHQFDTTEEIQAKSQRVLPGSVPKMKEMVGPVSTCGKNYFEGDGGRYASW
jgi:hypothetical protein